MKDISLPKKLKVIKLFFEGYTYDEIAEELGISKGSVVNIINEFRAGELKITPNEYIDALRELAVDIRKQHTTVKKLQMHVKIDYKVAEMGVSVDQVEDWLDIVYDIATEPAAMKPFVSAALEMSQMEMETGLNSAALVAEYKNTRQALNNLKEEVANTVKLKEEAKAELDAINQAKKEAQDQLDDFMVQNQLNWDKVKTVMAILEGEFSKKRLSEDEKVKISKRIAETASLTAYNKNIKRENEELEKHVSLLKEENRNFEMANTGLKMHNDQMASQVFALTEGKKVLEKQFKETKLQVDELKIVKSQYAEDIYAGWLVLAFLHNSGMISDSDFDWFVDTINGVRVARLGKMPKKAVDKEGNLICQCQVPVPHIPLDDCQATMNGARERLAEYLVPLVGDKFIPKFEYEQAKLMSGIKKMYENLSSALGHPKELHQPISPEPEATSGEIEPEVKPIQAEVTGETVTAPPTALKFVPDYRSSEAIKARAEADKLFGTKVGPRISSTIYPWAATHKL
jgi:transposase